RWKQIKEILAKAFEKETNEREDFILSACNGDSDLQKELESYLELYKEEDSFLEIPIAKLPKESVSVMLRTNAQVGPYTLVKQLGKGAFGVVWLAEKRTTIATSQVAIKIALEEEPDLKAIKQEASLWAQIGGHPNVLPMIEANIYDDQVVIVSEYAPDGSLESWMKKNNGSAPSVEVAVAIISGVLSGLEHLHSKKVLHRDLKPANILLQGETPRLADFGLSRILKTTSNSTKASGTPAYMSPESFDGKKVIQTDIWAAGVIFYQLLTSNFPFPVKEYSVLIGAIFTKDPDPLPDSLKRFQSVISKSLEKKSENRYQSASEMRAAIQSCLTLGQSTIKVEIRVKPAPNVEIGQGAFGEVWLGEKRTAITSTKVAIKLALEENPDLDAIKKEADIWAYIGNHPNVLPIIEADIYGEHILIVSEYAPDGSLEDWIKKNGGKAPSLESAIEMTKGVLLGLEHLHSKKVLHRAFYFKEKLHD
ncbi:MAG: serine/threonine protein kinase, partial [bacterium]